MLAKVFGALNNDGRFAFTLKQGNGEGWSEEKLNAPRFFCYWTEDQIKELLTQVGFSDLQVNDGVGARDVKWLHIIAYKKRPI